MRECVCRVASTSLSDRSTDARDRALETSTTDTLLDSEIGIVGIEIEIVGFLSLAHAGLLRVHSSCL